MGPWQLATVVAIRAETPRARTFRLKLPDATRHRPGQHYVMRLTAPDGYRAQRSYSVASAPGGDEIELTVELLDDGEVSGFLHDVVIVGDELEMRGPIGGFFAWDEVSPVFGVAGGSGVVPLMSMVRAARAAGRPELVRLVVSARGPDELYYAGELPGPEVRVAYTRTVPPGYGRAPGRLVASDLTGAADRTVYVCGAPPFCDHATDLLQATGVPPSRIKVERFGPSG